MTLVRHLVLVYSLSIIGCHYTTMTLWSQLGEVLN